MRYPTNYPPPRNPTYVAFFAALREKILTQSRKERKEKTPSPRLQNSISAPILEYQWGWGVSKAGCARF
jgi:hypothetical protein